MRLSSEILVKKSQRLNAIVSFCTNSYTGNCSIDWGKVEALITAHCLRSRRVWIFMAIESCVKVGGCPSQYILHWYSRWSDLRLKRVQTLQTWVWDRSPTMPNCKDIDGIFLGVYMTLVDYHPFLNHCQQQSHSGRSYSAYLWHYSVLQALHSVDFLCNPWELLLICSCTQTRSPHGRVGVNPGITIWRTKYRQTSLYGHPIYTDTPLIRKLSMFPLVSLLTGFDCTVYY